MLTSYDGSLAQSVEQLAFNQLVIGSNPIRPTIIIPLMANLKLSGLGSLGLSQIRGHSPHEHNTLTRNR